MEYVLRNRTHARPKRWATADDLPNELLLYIFPLLSLESLIAARQVNRRWRYLVPEAHICALRAKLLRLYLAFVHSPAFRRSSSTWSRLHEPRVSHPLSLQDCEREEYLRLITNGSDAPEEFKLWMREWPAHATWPPDDATISPSACASNSWCLRVPRKPHLKCVTFSGGKSPFDPGATLYATRILPIEFSGLSGVERNWTEGTESRASR